MGKNLGKWVICAFALATPIFGMNQDDAIDAAEDAALEAVEAHANADEGCGGAIVEMTTSEVAIVYRRYLTTYRHTPSKRQFLAYAKLDESSFDAALAEGNLEDIDDLLALVRRRNESTKLFERVVDRTLFSQERREAIEHALRTRSRILVTAAGPGALEEGFFAGLMSYCKKMDAELFVIPINMRTEGLDPRLVNTPGVHLITHDVELGDLTILATAIPAHRRNPFTNLEGLGNRMDIQIVGHPKLLDIQVPTLHNDWAPKRMLATGKVTKPFQEGMVRNLLGSVAQQEEMYGAIVLEKHLGNPRLQTLGVAPGFHVRHIEYVEGLGFSDQGLRFDGQTVKRDTPLGAVLGDVHVGHTDPLLIDALVEQILRLKPEYVFLHDIFNGMSISHHEFNSFMSRMDLAKAGKLNLRKEIHQVVLFINALMARLPGVKVVVDASNHDYWLKRRLEDAQKVMADLENARMSIQLWELHDREPSVPPLLHALRMFHLDHPERLLFLKHGQSFEFGGLIDAQLTGHEIQVGLHGHAGANGGKGSLLSLLKGVQSSISGDSHNADRRNHAVKAGTITKYKLGYNNEGFSSWAQAVVLFYRTGSKQTLRYTRGAFYSPAGRRELPEKFFRPGFPKISPTRSDGEDFKD